MGGGDLAIGRRERDRNLLDGCESVVRDSRPSYRRPGFSFMCTASTTPFSHSDHDGYKPKQSRGRDGVLSALNVAIETRNLAKEILNITPAKDVSAQPGSSSSLK